MSQRDLRTSARRFAVPRAGAMLDVLAHDRRGSRSLRTLMNLRWFALAGQALTIAAVVGIWDAPLPLAPMSALLLTLAASNLVVDRLQRFDSDRTTGAVVLFDVLLLTGLLALSGGPANPFSVLYLVHVMLAAIIATKRWTWMIIATSSAGFALLFAFNVPLPPELGGHAHHMGGGSYSAHLQGMWLAYTASAIAIGVFVSRLSDALRCERDRQEHASRLLGLAALAAGAAHEIGNPLGTIRIAAGEMEDDLLAEGGSESLLSDVRLINREVERAKTVLQRMAAAAGELRGEALLPLAPAELLAKAAALADREQRRVQLDLGPDLPNVRWPAEATAQAIAQVVRNALQASAPNGDVRLCARCAGEGVAVEVEDSGVGMDAAVLARVGEPFFTTQPGQGMGLGVFIARTLIERMGGEMNIVSRSGRGTTVSVWLPVGVETP